MRCAGRRAARKVAAAFRKVAVIEEIEMRMHFFAALAILTFVISGFAQENDTSGSGGQAGEVLATISDWADAVRDRDTVKLGRIFEEYVIITRSDGSTRGKKEELDLFRPELPARVESIRNEDVKVRVFGNTAVATGLNVTDYRAEGKTTRASFRYTATFVRQDGRWQIVALHTSRRSIS